MRPRIRRVVVARIAAVVRLGVVRVAEADADRPDADAAAIRAATEADLRLRRRQWKRHRAKAKRCDCQSADPMKPSLLFVDRHHYPPVVLHTARLLMKTTVPIRGFPFAWPPERPLSTLRDNFAVETSATGVS